jgi:hypothetical protein
MAEIRRITITGGAAVLTGAAANESGVQKTTTRRNRVKPSQIMQVVVEERHTEQTGGSLPKQSTPQTIKTIQITETVGQQPIGSPAITPAVSTGNGADTTAVIAPASGKVILGGKKPRNLKVLLTKKNNDVQPLQQQQQQQQQSLTDGGGRRIHRKVTLGLQHLKRRVTKARRLQKISKITPIEQIRKELIAAKIIKEDSKAPEEILRQMYSDAKLVTTKSL